MMNHYILQDYLSAGRTDLLDSAGKGINDESDIDNALSGRDVRNIRHP